MSRARRFLKETGEMGDWEIEKGGDWYNVRLEFEDICKKAGLKCKVRPFDQYQGPYAKVEPYGKLWLAGTEGPEPEFYFEYYVGSQLQEYVGFKEDMIDFLKELKKSGFKLTSQIDRNGPDNDQD